MSISFLPDKMVFITVLIYLFIYTNVFFCFPFPFFILESKFEARCFVLLSNFHYSIAL